MLEIWGGLECTVARVGGDYRDQSRETGHDSREGDLARIAALGIRTIRYPVLWEAISPGNPEEADFTRTDARIGQARQLGLNLIAGLCHHGSGPRHTDMLDPAWPEQLAGYAARVARRYPHLELYTPVNEPLTTARFSALYGHWYPHKASTPDFLRALVNECKATVLAMREIRKVRPDAKLVQTEDIGKTYSTPKLAYQAAYENERRWLSFDLLTGRVDRDHYFWRELMDSGVSQADLELLQGLEGKPDIIGVNHYLNSERYLDEQAEHFPDHHLGGNGRHRYADAEAVRVPALEGQVGPGQRLKEVWERYRLPMAVTEVHHGCTREEQLRWLAEVWQAATELRSEGADIRAITIWAMFGTVDWSSLLTQRRNDYEPGPFDVRGPQPRETALAQITRQLAKGTAPGHPVLDRQGWWRRKQRFYAHLRHEAAELATPATPRRVLITGTGPLAAAMARICEWRGLDFTHVPTASEHILTRVKPWAVIDASYRSRSHAALLETDASIAQACALRGIPLMGFSSEAVFDGSKTGAYLESDSVAPACMAGRGEAAREELLTGHHTRALIIRTSAPFGPWEGAGFLRDALAAARSRKRFAASSEIISPTYIPDLVHEALNLLIDGAEGIWHLASDGRMSWYDFARRAVEHAGLPADHVEQKPSLAARALASERFASLPHFEHAWERFTREAEARVAAA